jgi:DNA-binding NarL/FixJ family response regulator
MIRILLADDHTIFRQGLKAVIEKEQDLEVVQEAASGREAVSLAANYEADVVLLDISMPDTHGLDVLKQIRQTAPSVAILILTMHPVAQYGLRGLRAGGSGYLTKDCEAAELIAAIRKVSVGQMYISPALSELITGNAFNREGIAPHEILSDRELQILIMIANGRRVKDVADKLGVSPKTVSTYRHRLLKKLHMEDNEELCTYARNNGLLD